MSHKAGVDRVGYAYAENYVDMVKRDLKGWAKVTVAGSFRRKLKMLGDLDFVIVPNKRKTEEQIWERCRLKFGDPKMGGKVTIQKRKGTKKVDKKAQYEVGLIIIDMYLTTKDFFGPMMLYLTGSASENKRMRWVAKSRGLVLSQWGLRNRVTEELVGEQTERGIYESLGMTYKDPEERE